MTTTGETLDAVAEAGRSAALIGYLPVGFPTVEGSIEAMTALVESGVDIVEVGLPYSDPGMDGPVIQRAAEAALEGGVRT
ncbi:tryptophan synthase subunit alpha, partial [Geobacillus sp. MMMUD3]|nr:tryptophan synthase subunit alpha [Geobacillus sp. MMMUD3]